MSTQSCDCVPVYLSPYTYVFPADIAQRTCDLALTLPQNILNTPIGNTGQTLAALPLENVANLTGWICLVKRFKNWTRPNEDGKMLWQEDRPMFLKMLSLTGGQIINQTCKLETAHKLISLGKALNPLKAVANVLFLAYCICDYISSKNTMNDSLDIMSRAKEIKNKLIEAADINDGNDQFDLDRWKNFATSRISYWKEKLENSRVNEAGYNRLVDKHSKWTAVLAGSTSVERAKEFYNRKIEKRQVEHDNAELAYNQAWWSIAYDVSLTALIILGFALPFVTASAGIAYVSLVAASTFFEFSTALLDLYTCADEKLRPEKPAVNLLPDVKG